MAGAADRGLQWRAVGALSEPHRRSAYEFVCSEPGPVTRDDVSAGIGISRALAAFHLDKLVEARLLDAETSAAGRRAARVGRPAKLYRPSAVEVDLTLPPRRYDIAGRVLAMALHATAAGEPTNDALRRVAHDEGELLGQPTREASSDGAVGRPSLESACRLLNDLGYVPAPRNGHAMLMNCPFRRIAEVAPDVTCPMNHALIVGLLDGAGLAAGVAAIFEPRPDRCCVRLAPPAGSSRPV